MVVDFSTLEDLAVVVLNVVLIVELETIGAIGGNGIRAFLKLSSRGGFFTTNEGSGSVFIGRGA